MLSPTESHVEMHWCGSALGQAQRHDVLQPSPHSAAAVKPTTGPVGGAGAESRVKLASAGWSTEQCRLWGLLLAARKCGVGRRYP